LSRAFIFALFGILLLMILLFKNLYQPFVIAMTIPLGVVSVIWAFFLHGQPLTFMAMIGVIALAGVIVNNAIVFVDFVNKARGRGMEGQACIVDAAKKRLRPIFLTTVTTVAGVLPTAYGIGGLDPFVVPIALALGWGILFGSVLTTVVLPPVLAITEDIRSLSERVWLNLRGS
jgi:multidrug efflux pump subunit AcrB